MADTKQLMIQRLVDGELDRQQVRKLLHQAESESRLYRQMALAMIENQIWEREICQLDSADVDGTGASAMADGFTDSFRAVVRPESPDIDDLDLSGVGFSRWGQSFLALAVVGLLMTWLGYSAGQWRSSVEQGGTGIVQGLPDSAASNRIASAPGTGVRQISEDPYEQYSPYRMQMVSNEPGLKSNEQFPVLPISTARELGVKYEPIQAESNLQRKLNSQGFELRPEIQFIRVQMDDGRQIIVPVQRMQLRQWGQ